MSRSLHDEFLKLLEEIAKFDHNEFSASLNPNDFPIPTIISSGDATGYPLSKHAESILADISKQIQESKPEYQEGYSTAEFSKLTSSCIGTIVSSLSDDTEMWPEDFGQILKDEIDFRHTKRFSPRLFFFGAVLVDPPASISLRIGPCTVTHRDQWLAEQQQSKHISPASARRIAKVWNGAKISPVKSGKQNHQESAILKSIDGCSYVVSVRTNGPSAKQLQERALQCARIALLSIALSWQRPSSPMENFTLAQDRNRRLICIASIDTKRRFISYGSKSHHTFPHSAPTRDWQDALPKMQPILDVIGKSMEAQCDLQGSTVNKDLYDTLFQVLTLIHRGSVEPEPLFATALFGSAIDMMACGKGSGGISSLIEKQLGKGKKDALFKDGMTTAQFIEKVYNVGRSRTLHGSNPDLRKDWSALRMRAEVICRILLLSICDELHHNPKIDKLKHFMSLKKP